MGKTTLVIAIIAAAALAATGAVAQEGDNGSAAATILVPEEALDAPVPERGGATWRVLVHAILVEAEGEVCGLGDLTGRGDLELHIGGEAQPAACSTPGTALTVMLLHPDDSRQPLPGRFVVEEEPRMFTIDDLGALVPRLEEPVPEGQLDTRVVIPEAIADGELAEQAGAVTVFANGEACGTIDAADAADRDAEGNAVLALGEAGQAEPCRTPGSLVTFRSERWPDEDVLIGFWLEPGATLELTNFATEPPASDPAAPAAGGGLEERGSSVANWLFAAGAVLGAMSVVALWLARRARDT